jgi:hypothetical protein
MAFTFHSVQGATLGSVMIYFALLEGLQQVVSGLVQKARFARERERVRTVAVEVGRYLKRAGAKHLAAICNFFDHERTTVSGPANLTEGTRRIRVALEQQAGFLTPARITLTVDGQVSDPVQVPRTAPQRLTLDESFDIGSDTGTAVSEAYAAPHRFDGTISSVDITIRAPIPPATPQPSAQAASLPAAPAPGR